MNASPKSFWKHIHLCIMQPIGHFQSLVFLDPALHFKFQFERMGMQVTIGKNRLRHDAINFVFAAHLGFPEVLLERYSCIFVNLEQIGAGGADLPESYLNLLRTQPTVDYDQANIDAYQTPGSKTSLIHFLYVPYLDKPSNAAPSQQAETSKEFDALFLGAINPRRQAVLDTIRQTGVKAHSFEVGIFGAERDEILRQARCVINIPFYESARFEQVRVSHCLSLGVPVVSIRYPHTQVSSAFESCVFWVTPNEIEAFFSGVFQTKSFDHLAQEKLAAFRQTNGRDSFEQLLTFALLADAENELERTTATWTPQLINLSPGTEYKLGWLNIDSDPQGLADCELDFSDPLQLPQAFSSDYAGQVQLNPASVELIHMKGLASHVNDLPKLMTNCLNLLKDDGHLLIESPCDTSQRAKYDPKVQRTFNAQSWIYYTERFWTLGWFSHRFELISIQYLNEKYIECDQSQSEMIRCLFKKIPTTPQEKTVARTCSVDFFMHADVGPTLLPSCSTALETVQRNLQY